MNERKDRAYPLMEHAADRLAAASGRRLAEVDLAAAASGDLSIADLQVSAETLSAQAAIAEDAGFRQLAENLRRAAELTAVPNAELLAMYETLRPNRSTYTALLEMAERLAAGYGATLTAAFVREAAAAYRARGLVLPE